MSDDGFFLAHGPNLTPRLETNLIQMKFQQSCWSCWKMRLTYQALSSSPVALPSPHSVKLGVVRTYSQRKKNLHKLLLIFALVCLFIAAWWKEDRINHASFLQLQPEGSRLGNCIARVDRGKRSIICQRCCCFTPRPLRCYSWGTLLQSPLVSVKTENWTKKREGVWRYGVPI